MKLLLILCLIFFVSCRDNNKNIIDVNDIDEKIHIGMSKDEVIRKFKQPKDSIFNDLAGPEEYPYYYVYDTNDFSGYTLKISFDGENKVSHYIVD